MRKTLGLSIFSIVFLYSSLVAAQTCPDPTVTQPKPVYSDWAISSSGGSVTSSGEAQCCIGGTGWKRSVVDSSGVYHDAFVSAAHVEKFPNVISPDIGSRPTLCAIDKVFDLSDFHYVVGTVWRRVRSGTSDDDADSLIGSVIASTDTSVCLTLRTGKHRCLDKAQYLNEVEREVPSKIDGITVEVLPPDAKATDLMN
jgi:hypothetical protein